jgi:hypothetical protein
MSLNAPCSPEEETSDESVEHALQHMNSLTLLSPGGIPRSDRAASPSLAQTRPTESSFSRYLASPSSTAKPRAPSFSSTRTSCSSSRSSPRQVPLTVLSHCQPGSAFGSPAKTPAHGRPPVHAGGFLYSLGVQTPRADSMPTTPAMSPLTPLPKITLTPRRTQGHEGGLPVFPSHKEDGITLNPTAGFGTGPTLFGGFSSSHQEEYDMPYLRFSAIRPSTSMTFSLDDDNREDVAMDGSHVGSLRSEPPVLNLERIVDEEMSHFTSRFPAGNGEEVPNALPKQSFLDRKGPLEVWRSSLENGDIFVEMSVAEARANVLDAENGSLSDADDEHLVLASPNTLSTERQLKSRVDGRARQRRRFCINPPPSTASFRSVSMSSLASTQAESSTSLLGMDIVHENLTASATTGSTTPFSLLSSRAKAGSFGALSTDVGSFSSSLHRNMSESSLGLTLDQQDSCDRDLVTPPITVNDDLTPPPIHRKSVDLPPIQTNDVISEFFSKNVSETTP